MTAAIDLNAVKMDATATVAQPAVVQTPSPIAMMATNIGILQTALTAAHGLNGQLITMNGKAVSLLDMLKTALDAAIAAGNNDPALTAMATQLAAGAAQVAADNALLSTSITAGNAAITKDTPAP